MEHTEGREKRSEYDHHNELLVNERTSSPAINWDSASPNDLYNYLNFPFPIMPEIRLS